MSRALRRMPDSDVPALLSALRTALDGSGAAVLPFAALPHPTTPERGEAARLEMVEDDVALVIETSGSTGTPKRVGLSAAALLASARASAEWVSVHATRESTTGLGQWLLCLPAHYVAGTNVLVRSIHAGTEPVVMPEGHFDAENFVAHAARLSAPERYASIVPVQLARLVDAAEDDADTADALRRFDALLVGGQALRPELRQRAEALGIRVVRTYGSSETSGGCVYAGMPIGATRARVSGGQLELSGPTLAGGYLGDPERTAAAFTTDADGTRWYRTGDLGEVSEDGRVTVLGRADNVIISGGEKVLLDAVERHIASLPGLADAVVVAVDDAQWGQVPVVITTAGEAELAGIRSSTAAALGRAAAPARLQVVDVIPRLASGKPDRLALARLASPTQP
ncbi:AMP-binding protein [Gryllotalpicola protaetiae]|uniref:O-succinylbenzoate--CoA ligase n=1 Tax=Gryllotalpicola protaetiae TaxID=2419771 RepID=A0A387BP73_9MICO|nr:AMP-binding protein [Gryllotalpicola protaetiae]AYG03844.1 o-succinylbenzoate--CoA ligase [Gryllotalpicola protaetiae]